jgi:chromosome segregation ATPase
MPAPADLETRLNERIQAQEKQIQELQKQNSSYSARVKELIEKRDHLWDCIDDLKDELKGKKEELRDVRGSRVEHRRAEAALREELGLLRRQLRDQDERVAEATTEANEKAEQATMKQEELQKTVERLEKRLQERRKQVMDQQVGLSVASTEFDRKQALLKSTVVELRRRLQQQNERVLDQQASLAQATAESSERTRDAMAKQALLQENVEQLEMRLREQSKAFEEERVQLMQQASTRQSNVQAELSSSLDQAIPQLRSLLSAYDRVRGSEKQPAKGKQKQTSTARTFFEKATDSELEKRLKEQEKAFDQERAQLLEQASDAAKTQRDVVRQYLMEREGILTCPISLDLFEFPVVAGCENPSAEGRSAHCAVDD